MIKSILRYMLLLTLVLGCQNVRHSKEYYGSGKIKTELTTADGKIKCLNYYENGKLESEGEVLANGYRVGAWTYYDDDGKLRASGNYFDGLKDGNWAYNIGDSSYSIKWRAYINRPIRVNVPENWFLKEQLAPNIPLAGFSDSTNSVANFNIVLMNKEGKSIDSVINEGIRTGREELSYDIEVLSIKEVEINEAKVKVVTQRLLKEHKRLIVTQYFLDQPDDTIYLIAFFVDERQQAGYETLIREIAFSFAPV